MPKKGEKLDEAQLIKLGEARKKALEVRQEKATVKKQEKELATLERKEKSSSLKKQIDAKKSKKQEDHSVGYAQNEIIHQEQTIGQATFSSDEETEAEPITQPKVRSNKAPPRKVKKQVVYEEDSSSSEGEVEYKQVRRNKPQQSLQRDISAEERNAIIQQHYAEQQQHNDEQERQRYLGQAQQAIQTMPIRGGVRTNLFGGY